MDLLKALTIKIAMDTGDIGKGVSSISTQLSGLAGALSGTSGKAMDTSQKFSLVGKTMSSVGGTLTKTITAPLVGLGTLAVKSAIDYESAFAGVRKTTDATGAEFAQLSEGIIQMSNEIPAAATEIAGVAEAAGQLGISKEHLLDFSRVMIDLGNSTNMSAETAAIELARLANITGMQKTEFDRLGSSVVVLGNNLSTTESEISAMGLKLAGAGSQAGLSEAEIMGLGAALSSLGLEAEAGGSAFSKLMVTMQLSVETGNAKLGEFAEVAGMSSAEFARAFKEDASGALVAFIEGLGNAEQSGKSANQILEEMGFTEIRLSDGLRRTANAGDLVRNAIDLSTKAWEENTALTKEASERYKTTASQMQVTRNQINNLGIEIGNMLLPIIKDAMEMIRDLVKAFGNLDEGTKKTIIRFAAVAAAAGPAIKVMGTLTKGIGSVIKVGSGITKTISNVATGFKAARTCTDLVVHGFSDFTSAGAAGTSAATKLGAALANVNPVAAAVTLGVGALAAGIIALIVHNNKLCESAQRVVDAKKELKESVKEAKDALGENLAEVEKNKTEADVYIATIERLSGVEELNEGQKRLMKEAIDALNQVYPELNAEIDTTTGKLKGSVQALKENTQALYENAKAAAYSAYYEKVAGAATTAAFEYKTAQNKVSNAEKGKASAEKELSGYSSMQRQGAFSQSNGQYTNWSEEAVKIRSLTEEVNRYNKEIEQTNAKLPELKQEMDSATDAAKAFGEEAVKSGAMSQEQVDAWNKVLDEISDTSTQAGAALQKMSSEGQAAVKTLSEAMKKGPKEASKAWEGLPEAVQKELATMQTGLVAQMMSTGAVSGESLVAAFGGSLDNLGGIWKDIPTQLKQVLLETQPESVAAMIETGQVTCDAFAKSMSDGMFTIKGESYKMAEMTVSGISDALSGIGPACGSASLAGALAMSSQLASWAAAGGENAQAAIDAIASKTGLHRDTVAQLASQGPDVLFQYMSRYYSGGEAEANEYLSGLGIMIDESGKIASDTTSNVTENLDDGGQAGQKSKDISDDVTKNLEGMAEGVGSEVDKTNDNLGKLGSNAPEVSANVTGLVDSWVQSIVTAIGGSSEQVSEAFKALATNAGEGFAQGITGSVDSIKAECSNLALAVAALVASDKQPFIDAGTALAGGLVEGLNAGSIGLNEASTALANNCALAITTAIQGSTETINMAFTALGASAGASIATGLQTSTETILSACTALTLSIAVGISSNTESFVAAGAACGQSIVSGITQGAQGASGAGATIASLAAAGIQASSGTFYSAGVSCGSMVAGGIAVGGAGAAASGLSVGMAAAVGIRSGFASGAPAVVAGVRSCVTQANAAGLSMVPQFMNTGTRLGQGITNGMRSQSASVSAAAAELGRNAATTLSGYKESMASAGAALGEGAASGISSKKSAVESAAAELAQAATDAYKRNLGISSPSKVFRKLSENIPMGAAEGIESGMRSALPRMVRQFQRIPEAMQNNIPTLMGVPDIRLPEFGLNVGSSSAMQGMQAHGGINFETHITTASDVSEAGVYRMLREQERRLASELR